MTYEWQILNITTQDEVNSQGETLADSVVRVKWKKIATDENGNKASYLGYSTFTSENTLASDFIQYADLTEDVVIGWIQNWLTTTNYTVDESLRLKLEKIKKEERALPW